MNPLHILSIPFCNPSEFRSLCFFCITACCDISGSSWFHLVRDLSFPHAFSNACNTSSTEYPTRFQDYKCLRLIFLDLLQRLYVSNCSGQITWDVISPCSVRCIITPRHLRHSSLPIATQQYMEAGCSGYPRIFFHQSALM